MKLLRIRLNKIELFGVMIRYFKTLNSIDIFHKYTIFQLFLRNFFFMGVVDKDFCFSSKIGYNKTLKLCLVFVYGGTRKKNNPSKLNRG